MWVPGGLYGLRFVLSSAGCVAHAFPEGEIFLACTEFVAMDLLAFVLFVSKPRRTSSWLQKFFCYGCGHHYAYVHVLA